jgi:squalene synthase HpnC
VREVSTAVLPVPTREGVMTQAREENFPVASVLLGRRERDALLAIYGVARLIDDIGDESPGDRPALLDWVDAELDRAFAGHTPDHPVLEALARQARAIPLPVAPFHRLVDANRRDQVVTRYESFDDLIGYCELSAAPVGELVLHVFGAATPDRLALSARVCAGLQVTEHIQDVAEDYARGRVYIPRQDLEQFGCEEPELGSGSPRARELIAFETERARGLLRAGAPLARRLRARPRAAIAGFVAGGRASLDAIERSSYDVWSRKPRRTRTAFAAAFAGAVMGR